MRQHGDAQAIVDHLDQRVQRRAHHPRARAQVWPIARRQRMVLQAMAILQQQQSLRRQHRRRHPRGQVARLIARKRHQNRIVKQLRHLNIAAGIGQGQQHAIDHPPVQIVTGVAARFLAQEQAQIRATAAQAGQEGRQQKWRNRRDDTHPQITAQRLGVGAGQRGEFFRLAQHLDRLGRHLLAQRGKAHHPAGALNQRHPQQRLQLAQPRRQGGLGDAAGGGSPAKMAMRLQRHQILELFQAGQIGPDHR